MFRFQGGEERQRLLGLRAGDCLLLLLLAEDPPSAAIRGAPPGAAIAAAAVGPALRAALAQAAKAPLKRLAAGAAEAAAAARRGHIQGFRRGPLGCTLAGRCTGDRKVCGAWKGRSVCSHKECAQASFLYDSSGAAPLVCLLSNYCRSWPQAPVCSFWDLPRMPAGRSRA